MTSRTTYAIDSIDISRVYEGEMVPFDGILMPEQDFREIDLKLKELNLCDEYLREEKTCAPTDDLIVKKDSQIKMIVAFFAGTILGVTMIKLSH